MGKGGEFIYILEIIIQKRTGHKLLEACIITKDEIKDSIKKS